MIASQLLRLPQTDPGVWLFWDYAGRIGALSLLIAIPSARAIAFRHEELRPPHWEDAVKIVIALVLLYLLLEVVVARPVHALMPGTALGTIPVPHGWLRAFDLVAGIALAAYHEEVVFRRVAREALQAWVGDGWPMIVATSLLFAAYHWWTGAANICACFLVGVALMVAYRELKALWPLVVAHDVMDVIAFA